MMHTSFYYNAYIIDLNCCAMAFFRILICSVRPCAPCFSWTLLEGEVEFLVVEAEFLSLIDVGITSLFAASQYLAAISL